jgi:hypothetical protein
MRGMVAHNKKITGILKINKRQCNKKTMDETHLPKIVSI